MRATRALEREGGTGGGRGPPVRHGPRGGGLPGCGAASLPRTPCRPLQRGAETARPLAPAAQSGPCARPPQGLRERGRACVCLDPASVSRRTSATKSLIISVKNLPPTPSLTPYPPSPSPLPSTPPLTSTILPFPFASFFIITIPLCPLPPSSTPSPHPRCTCTRCGVRPASAVAGRAGRPRRALDGGSPCGRSSCAASPALIRAP